MFDLFLPPYLIQSNKLHNIEQPQNTCILCFINFNLTSCLHPTDIQEIPLRYYWSFSLPIPELCECPTHHNSACMEELLPHLLMVLLQSLLCEEMKATVFVFGNSSYCLNMSFSKYQGLCLHQFPVIYMSSDFEFINQNAECVKKGDNRAWWFGRLIDRIHKRAF